MVVSVTNFISQEYFTPENYAELKDSVDKVPLTDLSETLDQRLARATENFMEVISDPHAPQEEIDYATFELTALAQADALLNPSTLDSAEHFGWITKARRVLLDTWDRVYGEDPKIPVLSTVFFDDSAKTQRALDFASYLYQSPKITDENWDPYYHSAGLALGKISLVTTSEKT